ncbi:Por secretion system C-terminal sorting domain-containing protein [Tangfeifania diversioriginum]|uniref:Por secretion system C-terminal sorting domain-containing protein n=1 Tax=Tangfeifania diversioriginum TaxID=1168035 RepID=A0A1M6CX40_9BACT|nr:T9SS type A sorting domain-containing protein [Tangfeifania diversioriginum]SHI65582.1 Por secretion system C-terminal sorting domain-containing protein [Tangfeifania diversioriginum]
MKTLRYFIPVIICLFAGGILKAQVAVDPIQKTYKIGGSSELFKIWTTNTLTISGDAVLDVDTSLNKITNLDGSGALTKYLDRKKTACAVGDFDGDGDDDVVTVVNNSEEIWIRIPLIGDDLKIKGAREFNLNVKENDYTRMRMIAGNFDGDPQDEFAICYYYDYGTIEPWLRLFKTDSALNIQEIAALQPGDGRKMADIAAGDTDGDGMDEIVVVTNKAIPTRKEGSEYPIFISTYDLNILKLVNGQLTGNKKECKPQNYGADYGSYYPDRGSVINEMRIACGDLNNDGKDEVFVGWSFYYCHNRFEECASWNFLGNCTKTEWRNEFSNRTYLNAFKINGNSFENWFNIEPGLAFGFEQRNTSSDQHIAMTLKCEPLENLGRDVILINDHHFIYAFWLDGNSQLKARTLAPSIGYHLNLQGNEVFTVADLNPDPANLNFNKEVIMLQSDKSAPEQLNARYNGLVRMGIATIDQITTENITFKPTGPALTFSSGESFEVPCFVAGDFDCNDAEVYIVKPPFRKKVEDLQQPIVILNTPPMHFDIIGRNTINLSNAYNGKPSNCSAIYKTVVSDNQTTTVKIDKGMGISSELSAYAMAGGSGFEAKVNGNFEKNSSYFNTNSEVLTFEQSTQYEKGDYVLYSYLDYDYYSYPVYTRKGKKLGNIVVMNPVSEYKSGWINTNEWNHPCFVPNHDPGNILSYKQDTTINGFSRIEADFKYYKFQSINVSNNLTNGDFKFTFKNISSSGTTSSFSAGVGADLFVKIGTETGVTANLSPLGIGTTLSSQVKIGVSANLSANYHTSKLSTQTISLSENFSIEGEIGQVKDIHGDQYTVTPYIYRSRSGALVLDYLVNVDTLDNGFWKKNYGQNFDLAFILPWRYATEKGTLKVPVSQKQKTSDIQFYPPIASPGDTVAIIARVNNFSLKEFKDFVKIEFYIGEPGVENGGVKLTDIDGETTSSKYSKMKYGEDEREEYLTFVWEVPDTVTCSPRIYAVIDPDSVYTEIHENNNVGWNLLNIYGCAPCKYKEIITQTKNIIAEQQSFKAWPNPFSTDCKVSFSLLQTENVQIDLYNLAGHKISTVVKGVYNSGEHVVSLSSGNLGNGIYICKICAGTYSEAIKLIVLR